MCRKSKKIGAPGLASREVNYKCTSSNKNLTKLNYSPRALTTDHATLTLHRILKALTLSGAIVNGRTADADCARSTRQ